MTSALSSPYGCRWTRPFKDEPGQWKKQLAGKYLGLAERGDLTGIQSLLSEHPEYLNKRGSHGRTLLWVAIRRNRTELVKWLLAQGADANLTGCFNSESFIQLSPLAVCQFYKRPRLFEIIGACCDEDDIFRLVFRGEAERVAALLAKNPDHLYIEDPYDQIYYSPLLTFAIVGDRLDLAESLIAQGFEVPKYSYQLLFISAHFNNPSMIDVLLKHGARPDVGESSLWMSTNNLATLRKFVSHGLSANQRPYHGLTPLLYACRADKGIKIDKIRMLLDLGADITATANDGRSALHYAVMSGNMDACQLLLDAGIDPKQHNNDIPPASELAKQKGFTDIVRLIARY